MVTDRISENMTVVSADDRCIGFVNRLEGNGTLRITSVGAGCGYDHLIPLSWVIDVDKYVYLGKASAYIAANWRPLAPPSGSALYRRVSQRKPTHSFEASTKARRIRSDTSAKSAHENADIPVVSARLPSGILVA